MENDREARDSLFDLVQDIKAKLWLCARLELVCAVAGADSDCQRVNACLGNELLNLIRLRVGRILSGYLYVILDTCKLAELCLYHYAVCVCILNNLLGQLDVLLERILGAVDHNGSKAAVDAGLTNLKVCTVIQMKCDRDVRVLDQSSLNQLYKVGVVCILSSACGYLQDDRGIQLASCFRDRLYDFHIVYIECSDCITAFVCLFEHLSCGY